MADANITESRRLLQHFLAALAYRTQKALRDAPESFADFRLAPTTRTPFELVWHMTGVIGYARTFMHGGDFEPPRLASFAGEIARFPSVRNYVSYARLVRTERRSNDRRKGQANRRNGNPYLSWAFSEAAHFACRFQPEARRFYDRKRARTNGIIAIRALAHKLARACFFILRDRVPYDPAMLFRG